MAFIKTLLALVILAGSYPAKAAPPQYNDLDFLKREDANCTPRFWGWSDPERLNWNCESKPRDYEICRKRITEYYESRGKTPPAFDPAGRQIPAQERKAAGITCKGYDFY